MNLTERLKGEPVLSVAGLVVLLEAGIALAAAFGFEMSAVQSAALVGFVSIAATMVGALIQRHKSTPAKDVIEYAGGDGTVLAGEANEIPTDTLIRDDLGAEYEDDEYVPRRAA